MKIVANDGTEFKTVEEALAYEKGQEELMKGVQDVLQSLNEKLDKLKQEGWKVYCEFENNKLSITAKKNYEKVASNPLVELLGVLY